VRIQQQFGKGGVAYVLRAGLTTSACHVAANWVQQSGGVKRKTTGGEIDSGHSTACLKARLLAGAGQTGRYALTIFIANEQGYVQILVSVTTTARYGCKLLGSGAVEAVAAALASVFSITLAGRGVMTSSLWRRHSAKCHGVYSF